MNRAPENLWVYQVFKTLKSTFETVVEMIRTDLIQLFFSKIAGPVSWEKSTPSKDRRGIQWLAFYRAKDLRKTFVEKCFHCLLLNRKGAPEMHSVVKKIFQIKI